MKEANKIKSEKEEAEFWDQHSAAEYIEGTEEVKGLDLSSRLKEEIIERRKKKKKLLTLRLDQETIEKAKEIARTKSVGYQTLMRMWIVERIHSEGALQLPRRHGKKEVV